MSMIMKNARRLELNTKNVSAVFNIQRSFYTIQMFILQ